jgi:lysophospholipase L1-like esterase
MGSSVVWDLEAIPGLTTTKLLKRLERREIPVWRYRVVVVHVGTNDIDRSWRNKERRSQGEIMDNMISIHRLILAEGAEPVFSSILPRPRDAGDDKAWQRMSEVNNELEARFGKRGFLRSYRPFQKARIPRADLYHRDGLHLSEAGLRMLHRHFDGSVGLLLGRRSTGRRAGRRH